VSSVCIIVICGKYHNELCVNFLSGIKIGEIGTKLGLHAVNNGFLGFENVRIPREHMLMKNTQVLEVSNISISYLNNFFLTFILKQVLKPLLSRAVLEFQNITPGSSIFLWSATFY
jgi:hypothetical protein